MTKCQYIKDALSSTIAMSFSRQITNNDYSNDSNDRIKVNRL